MTSQTWCPDLGNCLVSLHRVWLLTRQCCNGLGGVHLFNLVDPHHLTCFPLTQVLPHSLKRPRHSHSRSPSDTHYSLSVTLFLTQRMDFWPVFVLKNGLLTGFCLREWTFDRCGPYIIVFRPGPDLMSLLHCLGVKLWRHKFVALTWVFPSKELSGTLNFGWLAFKQSYQFSRRGGSPYWKSRFWTK